MNYHLRTRAELMHEWHLLKDREKYIREELALALQDIHADRSIIEIELKLLDSLGKGGSGDQ